ncbi:FHA domain-containing protein [Cellulosilyticum ruminicola]|uniref:FHA domain-containing protein n=1 Tax=Cellulosilyticum ruminicola TaxID=425254 RepID=UPI0006D12953|nr:FHA domain-containing protein [Cellulosilyticum ruminicola]
MEQLIILAQQPTQLSDQNFNLEGWMLIGAGIAICLAVVLIFFFNKLFFKRCIDQSQVEDEKEEMLHKKQEAQDINKAKQLRKVEEAEKARALRAEEVTPKVALSTKQVAMTQSGTEQTVNDRNTQMPGGIEINLIDINDLSKSVSFYLKHELIVGRNPQKSQVVIADDPTVSSKHCKFYAFDDKVYLMDLGSTNGTFVNGKPIEYAVVLNIGDKIAIGARKFHVRW